MSWYNPFSWGEEDSSTEDAQAYLAQMEPMLHQYYDPYVQMGQRAMPTLEEQYGMLVNDPAAMQTMLGAGYTQSPGYEYQYDTAMNAGNQALSAGGMLGTPAAQTQMMGTAQGLANEDYWNYYNQNAKLYGMGLSGTQGLFDTGYNATNQLTGGLGNLYGSQANMAYANKQSQDQMLASLLGAGVGAAGYALGGPAGGMAATGATKAMGLGGSNPSMATATTQPYNYSQAGWML